MGNEPTDNFSVKDGYLRVAGVYGRAEYLEKIRHDHALGKLMLSGLPNGTGERAYIPPLTLIDYRLAFGPDDAGVLAIHKNLASQVLQQTLGYQHEPFPHPYGVLRIILADGDTEIDSYAYNENNTRQLVNDAKAG